MLTFDPSFFIGVFPRLISALPFTVEVIIASILLCLFFGTIIAVIRIARVPVLAPFCDIWLSYNRSMPFILDLYLVYFCLPAIIRGLGINPDGWPLTVYVLVSLLSTTPPLFRKYSALLTSLSTGDSMKQPSFSDFLRFGAFSASSLPRRSLSPFPDW